MDGMTAPARGPLRVLAIDDSPEILSLVQRGLSRHGIEVCTAADGESARARFREERPDLVLLDLMLPDVDGLDLYHELQDGDGVPVIMLTARDTVRDRVVGLRAGADDYVVKPFAIEELVARIEAVLRRRAAPPAEQRYEDLRIDTQSHQVFRGEREIELTPTEFRILDALARHPGRVVTRAALAAGLWDQSQDVDDNLLDSHVANLRRKLETGGGRRLVQTVRGIGFVLR